MTDVDMSKTIIPKSDQLNADDLISGPITILITSVTGNDDPQQPVSVHFQGDGGKPYKPGKSMRRIMVKVWGPEAKTYKGRSMTLYRDENVMFGGIKVGGIRISHMSHIKEAVTLALTETRAKRSPYTVKPLVSAAVSHAPAKEAQPPTTPPPRPPEQEPSFTDPLSSLDMDLSACTQEQADTWVMLLKAFALRETTPQNLMALWKGQYGRIADLQQNFPTNYQELEAWWEHHIKGLRKAEKPSG